MLTLAPFGGLQAALKRRNSSKASIPPSLQQQANGSNYLTLPGNIRRFASTEALSSLSSTSLGIANVNRRRGSLSRRMRKVSPAVSQTLPDLTTVCLQLDLHIAKIKKTLAEFREEDIEIADRVDDLMISVGTLCEDFQIMPLTQSVPDLVQQRPTPISESDGDGDDLEMKSSESGSEVEDENFVQGLYRVDNNDENSEMSGKYLLSTSCPCKTLKQFPFSGQKKTCSISYSTTRDRSSCSVAPITSNSYIHLSQQQRPPCTTTPPKHRELCSYFYQDAPPYQCRPLPL